MPRSKQGSARDLALSFATISVCTSAHLFRSLLTRPSVLRLVRLIMTPHASMAVTWVPHPVPVLRSVGCGCLTLPCHPGSHRGHPIRRLVQLNSMHQPSPMVGQPTMLLHAPTLWHASSADSRVTTCDSVPRTTTQTSPEKLLAVASQHGWLNMPSRPPLQVAM